TRCIQAPKLKECLPLVQCTSSLPVNKLMALPVGSFPFAVTIAAAEAELEPPPIVIWPGSRPVMNDRFAGIGLIGAVATGAKARENQRFKAFRRVGENTCVSCNESPCGREPPFWLKIAFGCGSALKPSEMT